MATDSKASPESKTIEEFQKEFRNRLYAAIAASIIAGFGAAIIGIWGYLKTLPGSLGLIPSGAVIAFWTEADADQSKACPNGWTFLREAVGRGIVGAGKTDATWQQYADGSMTPNGARLPFTARKPQDIGGEENHQLGIREMPAHSHSISLTRRWGDKHNGDPTGWGGDDGGNGEISVETTRAGEGQPYNNMSPYIALYYCRKN